MRLPLLITCAMVGTWLISFAPSAAQADPFLEALASARRCLESAQIEYRLYQQVEYPRESRRLDAAIQLTRAEVESLRRRLREYSGFNKFQTGNALLVSWENAKLQLLDAELRLKDLVAERNALQRFRGDQCRLLELKVYDARARLRELEHGEVVLVETVAAE